MWSDSDLMLANAISQWLSTSVVNLYFCHLSVFLNLLLGNYLKFGPVNNIYGLIGDNMHANWYHGMLYIKDHLLFASIHTMLV